MRATVLWNELKDRYPLGYRVETGSTQKGVPDCFLIVNGQPVMIELKAEGDRVSGHQRRFMEKYSPFLPCVVWRGKTNRKQGAGTNQSRIMSIAVMYRGHSHYAEVIGRPRECVNRLGETMENFIRATEEIRNDPARHLRGKDQPCEIPETKDGRIIVRAGSRKGATEGAFGGRAAHGHDGLGNGHDVFPPE